MPAGNTGSYFARDTNASITQCAVAASDASYRHNNNFTVSLWHAGSPGINKNIASVWRESSNERLWLLSNQTDGSCRLILSASGTGVSSNHKTATPCFDFSWKHIVFWFASGVFGMKINDVLQTLTVTTAWTAGAVSLYSGATTVQAMLAGKNPNSPIADDAAGGCYGDFSLFNKVLSASEITELYNQGRPRTASHSAYGNCTNHWPVDQNDSATELRDVKNGAGSKMTITKSGANAVFDPSANYPKVEDTVAAGNVLSGITFDVNQTGTLLVPTAAQVAAQVLDTELVETGYSVRNSQRLMLAALAGKVSGASTNTVTIRDVNDSKNRIVATVDSNGNRTAVTKDVS